MPLFHFESKKDKRKKEIKSFAKELVNNAMKDFHYDPDKDPVVQDFRKKMKDIKKKSCEKN